GRGGQSGPGAARRSRPSSPASSGSRSRRPRSLLSITGRRRPSGIPPPPRAPVKRPECHLGARRVGQGPEPDEWSLELRPRLVVGLVEAQVEVTRLAEALDHAPGSRLGGFPPPTPGAPDPGVERLVVQLDHLEELGVIRVSLGEPPRDHRVMVLALSGPASVDAILERVVDEGDEAQPL